MNLLQNKSTGEIGCLVCSFGKTPEKITVVEYIDGRRGSKVWYYNSLAELNEEWEDYEETKEFWFIDEEGIIRSTKEENWPEESVVAAKSIGNYFETKEEAEKAVEKLKAWKRLKDKGFRFVNWTYRYDQPRVKNHSYYNFIAICKDGEVYEDIDLLFGGEE